MGKFTHKSIPNFSIHWAHFNTVILIKKYVDDKQNSYSCSFALVACSYAHLYQLF